MFTLHDKNEGYTQKHLGSNVTSMGQRVASRTQEDEVKLPNNFYSAMGQLKSLKRRLQKDDTFRKRYQETIDTDD